MTIGSTIAAANYVAIQDKAQALLGTGSGSRGYNQTVISSDVLTGAEITKEQWDLLKTDIVNILFHQEGSLPSIITINRGDVIQFGAGHPNTNYNTLLDTATTNRFRVATNQSVISSKGSATYTSAWSNSIQFTLTVTGTGATSLDRSNNLRYFFNSGGKVRITPSITGGSSTRQIDAWKTLLNTAGIQSFGAATNPTINYYTLTNSFQTYYTQSSTGVYGYAGASYRLEARTDVANNSIGTATTLFLRATLTDLYTDTALYSPPPGDSIDGTLTIAVEELKASGTLLPTGTFSIVSPAYSLSTISGS
jgi:hypothetical protein